MKICGVDEVGVASIAGPVFVCAVIVDTNTKPIPGVTDSKKVSKSKRERLFPIIKEKVDAFAYGSIPPRLIEKMNIHYAKLFAMRKAVEALIFRGYHIDRTIVDGGFEIPDLPRYVNQEARPKADRDFWEVSAASILAKVSRDRIMEKLSKRFSYYDWESNAGYYSPKHRDGIAIYGPSILHRTTFEYYKYCMFCHEDFKVSGKTKDEYTSYLNSFGMHGHHRAWKRGEFDTWKPIIQ